MQPLTTLKQQLLKREEHGGDGPQKADGLRALPERHVLWPLPETDTGSDTPLVWPCGPFLCSYLQHLHLYS